MSVKPLFWKVRYAIEIRRLLFVPILVAWDMDGSAVENLGSDIDICSPLEAAEEERDEWIACADSTLHTKG